MKKRHVTRRRMLKTSLAAAGGAMVGYGGERAWGFAAANDRPRIGAIGVGSRWYIRATGIDAEHGAAPDMRKYGDYVAVCDVDEERRQRAGQIVKDWTGAEPERCADYRAIIDRDDIDIVHISTPDHWHAKAAIEAMRSGKDVYCEKPMTLTIDEGRLMCQTCRDAGRVVQIGTQQRSNSLFLTAIALIQAGRLGKLRKATCGIGGAPTSPQLPQAAPPSHLDWNQWLGPAPRAEYRYLPGDYGETKSWSRGHYEFRWWYEYSGGKLTDWGAHHVDIATWGAGKAETGPTTIDPVMVEHPVAYRDGFPTDDSRYNTATKFLIKALFADGFEIEIRHDGDNGILFEGDQGRIFVNRGRLSGEPVEDLKSNPLPAGALEAVYKGRAPVDHFRNFFESVAARQEPISDVYSHHRALSTCHLAGIAARLGRALKWDPQDETIINDAQAQSFVAREPRRGFEIET